MRRNTKGLGDNSFFAGCPVCHLSSPLWGWGGFSADGAVWSPSIHFFYFTLGWPIHHCKGMAATLGGNFSSAFSILIVVGASIGGIDQDALALNKFVEAGMVLGHGCPLCSVGLW